MDGSAGIRERFLKMSNFKSYAMKQKPHYISICNLKGGVGKSTFTVLLASLLHYRMGRRVLVADCDYPQWSIHDQRKRELELMDRTDYYKLMMMRQWKTCGQKIWPVLECKATEAVETVERFLAKEDRPFDYVLFDLPGTAATAGVLRLVSSLEYLFIPMKADKFVMESTITFARMVTETFMVDPSSATRGVHLFWSMIDGRERTGLYEQYGKVLESFALPVMQTRIPLRTRFNKELVAGGGPVYRSTLYPADKAFVSESRLDALAQEMCSVIEESR